MGDTCEGVWHIGAPAPHCSPASLEPAPKLDKIGGNWPKLVQIGPNESYSVVSVFIAGWGRSQDLRGGGRGPRGGWWGRSPSSSSTSLTPPPWHQITPRYSPQSLRKLQWLAPRKISQIGRYVRGNGPRTEAGHLPHGLNQSESLRPNIPQWESLLVAAVAEPGGLGGCVGLRRDQGNIGWNPALLPAGMSRDAFDGCAGRAQPDISWHGLLGTSALSPIICPQN